MDSPGRDDTYDSQPWLPKPLEPRDNTMLDLPDELILEIFSSLNLDTILAMRRVCRRLMAISKTRSLWFRFFDQLLDEMPGFWHGSKYETLDAPELERLVVRAVRLEKNWSTSAPVCKQPPQQLRLEEAFIRYLIPGGRWLISGIYDASSRLVYNDLDAPSSGPFDLLRHPEVGFLGEAHRIAVHLETESETLAFTIAVAYLFPYSPWTSSNFRPCCSVWHIQLEDAERFKVSHRTLFPLLHPNDFGNDSFVMDGEILLRGTDHEHARVFEVFDYLNCSDHQLRRGLVVLPRENDLPDVYGLRIMPSGQFLVVATGIVQLFNVPELFNVPPTSIHPQSGSGYPLWTYNWDSSIDPVHVAITPPHLAFRRSKDSCFGLLIQAEKEFLYIGFPPKHPNLLDVQKIVTGLRATSLRPRLGSHRGVWYDRLHECLLLNLTSFEVPGSKNVARELAGTSRSGSNGLELISSHVGSRNVHHRAARSRPSYYFDEASGRILIPFESYDNVFMLLEFA